MHLIYGILEQPVRSLQAINISAIHRGLQRVQLLKPNITIPELPSDMKTMEITAPGVVIPSQETTYWCYMAELPDGFAKHHIVMVRGRRRGERGEMFSLVPLSSCVQVPQSRSAKPTSALPFHREGFRPKRTPRAPKHLPEPARQAAAPSHPLENPNLVAGW